MKRSVEAAVVIAVIVLFFSLTLTTQTETFFPPIENQMDTSQQFALSVPLVLGITQANSPLNQTTRAEIYSLVQENPGIHFRGICDSLGLSVGMVQYHAGILVSAGLLSVYSDGNQQRYFVAGKYSTKKMKIISSLRHKTRGAILRIISAKTIVTHGKLVAQLAVTSQGITWQMNRLRKEGIVQQSSDGLKLTYFFDEAAALAVKESISLVK